MLISVIIPTRERAEYLKASLATCVAIRDPQIEIIVSDNASEDRTRAVVESFDDPRIVYVNTGQRTSMRQNYNFAISKSRGEYIIIIGDDDGMVPGQFPALRRILEEHKPNILSWRDIPYAWPEPGSGRHGHVRLRRSQVFGIPTEVDTAPLARGIVNAASPYSIRPALYHGCVARKVLERMKAHTGSYLNARAPDIYFENYAVFAENSFLFAEHTFSIRGYGSKSSGGSTKYNPSDPRAKPNIRFAAEVQADPLVEQFSGATPTVRLIIFATFEMVRHDWSTEFSIKPDYRAWYRLILARDRHLVEVYPTVVSFLSDYAASINNEGDLTAVMDELAATHPRVPSALQRIAKNFKFDPRKLTLSSRQHGVSTVATAASVLDEVLGDDQTWLVDPGVQTKLWRRARLRAWQRRVSRIGGSP